MEAVRCSERARQIVPELDGVGYLAVVGGAAIRAWGEFIVADLAGSFRVRCHVCSLSGAGRESRGMGESFRILSMVVLLIPVIWCIWYLLYPALRASLIQPSRVIMASRYCVSRLKISSRDGDMFPCETFPGIHASIRLPMGVCAFPGFWLGLAWSGRVSWL